MVVVHVIFILNCPNYLEKLEVSLRNFEKIQVFDFIGDEIVKNKDFSKEVAKAP